MIHQRPADDVINALHAAFIRAKVPADLNAKTRADEIRALQGPGMSHGKIGKKMGINSESVRQTLRRDRNRPPVLVVATSSKSGFTGA
jgi:hypothetical protein